MKEMNIYQLSPINPDKHVGEWQLSTTQDDLIIRAESEDRARRIAASVSRIARIITDNNTPNSSPWLCNKLSSCSNYVGSQFHNDGKEEILVPACLQREWESINSKRLLLDTGVWISYFGDRPSNQKEKIDLAKIIVNYCIKNRIKLFYCPYVENELTNGQHYKNRNENIALMQKIADKLPAHIGNDTWDKIHVKGNEIGSLWNNTEERNLADQLQDQLPDTIKKSNRIDRNIVLTAKMQKIDAILHENPKDFDKFDKNDTNGIVVIDLTKINSLDEFIKKL